MPAQNATSLLATKFKSLNNEVKKHAKDETNHGMPGPLPPGINAVAQLKAINFDVLPADTKMKKAGGKSAAGELRCTFQAVIMEPEFHSHNGVDEKIGGRQVWLFFPMYDTDYKNKEGKTVVVPALDYITGERGIMNEMRKLGGDDYTESVEGVGDLVGLAKGLVDAGVCFKFTTTFKAGRPKQGGGNYPDGVWENWNGTRGMPKDYAAPDASADAVDDTTAADDTPDDDTPAEEEDDLDALLAKAADNDADAVEKIKAIAEPLGMTGDDIENAPDWDTVKEWIEAGGMPKEAEENPPTKGMTVKYVAIKDGKKLKAQTCDVTAVNAQKKTCDLKNLATKALIKGVPFDQVEPA